MLIIMLWVLHESSQQAEHFVLFEGVIFRDRRWLEKLMEKCSVLSRLVSVRKERKDPIEFSPT